MNIKNNWYKYFIGFAICFLIRLIPFRPPNIEPVLAAQMPFSKIYGKLAGFLFAFASIFFYDALTEKIGIWTLITAVSYGLIGIWASVYFKKKSSSVINYVKFAIVSTLAFDIVTGLSIGPIFFNQSFWVALIGQIPFTLMHLLGNIGFAITLSPLFYTFASQSKGFEKTSIIKIFNPKQA